MIDRDQEMMDYIDEHIVRGRTSDAADDSSGAAWAAYERGEYHVPDWYSKEHRAKNRSYMQETIDTARKSIRNPNPLTWDTFLRSMGILFLVLLGLSLILFIIGSFTS